MEKEYQISWLKVAGVLVLIVVVIALLCVLYPKKDKDISGNVTSTYIHNITLMKEAGFEYFQGTNLPDKIGASNKISLEEMVQSNLMVEFVDEVGNTCNKEDSYVQVTKSLEDEYSMKVFLSCDTKSDYIVTTIVGTKCENCNSNNSQTTQNNSSSNPVINNSTNNNNQNSTPSYTRPSYVNHITTTNYHINYVNNCGNCSGNNCGNQCVSNVYYTVTFNSNGGTPVASQTKKYGDTADYSSTTREGYQFLGWYLDGEKYDFSTPITKKITLLAKWKKIEDSVVPTPNRYDVCFVTNGGTKIDCQNIEEGNRVNRPSNPTRACYSFAGWYTNSTLTNSYNFNNGVYRNLTLYAKWVDDGSCRNDYQVKFNSNGGSSVSSQTVYEGERAKRPSDPTRACYSFAGWYTNSTLTNSYNFNNGVYRNLTLYAKWVDDGSCRSKYQVRFNSNGGSSVSSQTVYEGERAYEPYEPYRNGYTFKGWYKNSSLTQSYNFSSRVYGNLTLYAKWEKDEVKYHTYCKIENERIYSTGYVDKGTVENKSYYNYSYQLKYLNRYAQDMKVIQYGTLSNSEYTSAYNYWRSVNKPITMINGSGNSIDAGSGTSLKTYSLKSSNLSTSVTYNYHSGNYWYFTVNNHLYNLYSISASKYYTSSNYYVYFVPLYFDIEYTNTSNCKNDTAANSYRYNNYKIVDTYYR